MVDINLLPWRVYEKEYFKIQFKKWGMLGLIFISIVSLLGFLIQQQIEQAQQTIEDLKKQQIMLIDSQKATGLGYSRDSLNDIQKNKIRMDVFFQYLFRETPADIVFKNILSEETQIFLTGNAESFSSISLLVKELENKFHCRVEWVKLKNIPHSHILQFHLRIFQLFNPLSN